jgi:hypothetical protein
MTNFKISWFQYFIFVIETKNKYKFKVTAILLLYDLRINYPNKTSQFLKILLGNISGLRRAQCLKKLTVAQLLKNSQSCIEPQGFIQCSPEPANDRPLCRMNPIHTIHTLISSPFPCKQFQLSSSLWVIARGN